MGMSLCVGVGGGVNTWVVFGGTPRQLWTEPGKLSNIPQDDAVQEESCTISATITTCICEQALPMAHSCCAAHCMSGCLPPVRPTLCLSSQTCMMKQDHGLDTGLDVFLVPQCKAALPDGPGALEPEPV